MVWALAYLLGMAVTALAMGRCGADEPTFVFGSILWPLIPCAMPFFGLYRVGQWLRWRR